MNRKEIRELLKPIVGNLSDSQLRRILSNDLGLPVDDGYSYTDEQCHMILESLKARKNKVAEKIRYVPEVDANCHKETTTQSQQVASDCLQSLAATRQTQMAAIQQSLQLIADKRNQAIDRISDVLAYLNSPEIFQAEVMSRTVQKMNASLQKEGDFLAGLPEEFDLLADSVEYPGFVINPIAGCLPS
jgi:hypothetical protein